MDMLLLTLRDLQEECDRGDAAFIIERYCGLITMARPHVLATGTAQVITAAARVPAS